MLETLVPFSKMKGESTKKQRRYQRTVARGPVPRERWGARGMARDRPSPYEKKTAYHRTVARGPVPRDRWDARCMARDRPSPYKTTALTPHRSAGACPPRSLLTPTICRARAPALDLIGSRCSRTTEIGPAIDAWRGTGPRPTKKTALSHHRSAGACPPRTCLFTVARGPVPRDRCLPQPSVGQEHLLLTRSGAGAPELQRWAPQSTHGEGNPLAGAGGIRGPKPYGKARRYRMTGKTHARSETRRSLLPRLQFTPTRREFAARTDMPLQTRRR